MNVGGQKKKGIGGAILTGVVILGIGSGAVLGVNSLSEKMFGKGFLSSIGAKVTGQEVVKAEEVTGQALNLKTTAGEQATLSLDAYDLEADDETLISSIPVGVYKILNADGDMKRLLDVTAFNTSEQITSSVVGQQLAIFGGDSSYYLDPKVYDVVDVVDTINLDAHKIATLSDMSVSVLDEDGNGLTPDDDATNNNADYSIDLLPDQEKLITMKFINNNKESVLKVKAIGVFHDGNIKDLVPTSSDWVKAEGIPDELAEDIVTFTNDAGTDFTTDYDAIYVYKPGTSETFDMKDYVSHKIDFIVQADDVDPVANAGDFCGAVLLDGAWAKNNAGEMEFDYYKHDADEKVSEVGMAETVNSPEGLEIGALIEGQ